MSDPVTSPAADGTWRVPMRPRSPDQRHRAATTLELFFDLVFVVAVAQAAAGLHHAIAEAHVGAGVLGFALIFFAIWWAWMNFTWFASAYDPDDVAYRLVVFVQLTGALVLAAGVPRAFESLDFRIVVLGYVIMRLALVTQWLRAAHADRARRTCSLRYAGGISAVQLGWILLLRAPADLWLYGFTILAVAELAIPVWAERRASTTWHAGHIAERYGLFTIIVLGESILAATIAIQTAAAEVGLTRPLVEIVAGGLLIVFSMWWFYFDRPVEHLLTSLRRAFVWGYGHFFVFAAAAAVGAGLAVQVDHATHHTEIGATLAGAAVAVPVALYIVSLWLLHHLPRADAPEWKWTAPAAAGLILLTPLTGHATLFTGLVLTALLSGKLIARGTGT